jgi:peptidoglycan L-alanyl-D-glutamate endopeptidase CwlK
MERLHGVHPLLVDWALRVVSVMDCTVVSGVRSLTTQAQYVAVGASQTMKSRHLVQEDGYGHAIDLAPYPIDWDKLRSFDILAGVGLAVAHDMGIPVTWGGDWNRDMDVYDNEFNDLGHFQIEIPYIPGVTT